MTLTTTGQKKWLAGSPSPPTPRCTLFERETACYVPESESCPIACKADRLKPVLRFLRGERTAAAATASGLRILEHKAAPHQVFLIVQRGVVQIKEALRVHEQPRTVFLDHFVAVARLRLQTHRVGQPGAAAALHAHAQAAGFRRHAFLGEQLLNFRCRFFRNMNHRLLYSVSFQNSPSKNKFEISGLKFQIVNPLPAHSAHCSE